MFLPLLQIARVVSATVPTSKARIFIIKLHFDGIIFPVSIRHILGLREVRSVDSCNVVTSCPSFITPSMLSVGLFYYTMNVYIEVTIFSDSPRNVRQGMWYYFIVAKATNMPHTFTTIRIEGRV